jgi:hypothetical protein
MMMDSVVPLLASFGDTWLWPLIGTIFVAALFGGIYWVVKRSGTTEVSVQQVVHQLEEGGWVRRFKVVVVIAAIAFLNYLWFFKEGNGFKGLANEKAIEQAQIAREISRGNGFTTKMIRPAAIRQFERAMNSFPLERTPDTYHAPLGPWINAQVFRAVDVANAGVKLLSQKAEFFERYTFETAMTSKLIVYSYDRVIAFVQMLFFLLAVIVNYFIARRLFDDRLAVMSAGLMLLCQKFWDFAMSGLPQMLLLFLLSCAAYTLVRAIEARTPEGKPWPWLAAAAGFFGLLALAHALTIFIFLGVLVFVAVYFRPAGTTAIANLLSLLSLGLVALFFRRRGYLPIMMIGIFFLFYGPWMVRNYQICGSPVGLGWYSALYQVRGTESQVMRSMELPLSGVSPTVFRAKVQGQLLAQMGGVYEFFGRVLLAPIFFVALLHLFKRPETANFRWCILSMWSFAVLGMAIFGMPDSGALQPNDLHILFVPLMTFYGLAFILVMWSRLEINIRLVRLGFLGLLYAVSAFPFINQFLFLIGPPTGRVQWPPYVPPYIAILGQWTREREIITSDMPWAVAWYADRKSLWLPNSVRDYLRLNDYEQLKGQMVGLYLTPITGNRGYRSEIMKGEYKEWAPFILYNVNLREFPLKAFTPLPIDGECIYYSDRDRWTNRED